MSLIQLTVFALAAIIIGRLGSIRGYFMLGMSVFVIFWLQPAQPVASLAFWLPVITLGLTIFIWMLVSSPQVSTLRENRLAALVIIAVILLFDFNQYFGFNQVYITTTPPVWSTALVVVAFIIILIAVSRCITRSRKSYKVEELGWSSQFPASLSIMAILFLLLILKTPQLMTITYDYVLQTLNRESDGTKSALSWLGYSYAAFRLIHILRDHQAGRLPHLTLCEFVNYVIFFPAFTAGPIDRAERFVQDLRSPAALKEQDWLDAGKRFFLGLFKKFVIADALAVFAINDIFVVQTTSLPWLWLFLYTYSFRIYFDFSGYTDIAIGLARLMGIRLPENFSAPYLKPNLTLFWSSWHITLTQWFRSYYFNPTTRWLRMRKLSKTLIVFIAQLSTMVLIGLWHGVTWGFAAWGLWHGVGLFIQNRWSEMIRNRFNSRMTALGQRALSGVGIFLTFNFVSIGWLFFTLSSPALAWRAFLMLFGISL